MFKEEELNVVMMADRIIVRPDEVTANQTTGGIKISKEQVLAGGGNVPFFGTVVTCGPDCKRIKQADYVCFIYYSGTPFEFGGKTHLILREADIIMIVNNTKEATRRSFLSTVLKNK